MPKRVPKEALVIGQNIRKLRKSQKFSQAEMGAILGVSFQQMQKYERGHNRFPVEKLYMLKQKFDVPYDWFFEGMPSVAGAQSRRKPPAASPFPASNVLHSLDMLQDRLLKRKIENIIEILLS